MKINYLKALTFAVPAVLIVTVLLLATGHGSDVEQKLPSHVTLRVAGKNIVAEVANTPQKRSRGLMFVESLPENEGMFFIFETEDYHSFWMKNTLIPLDIVWLDREFTVADISAETPPCITADCPTYSPDSKAIYVLELNGGWASKNNLNIGDTLSIVE